MGKPHALKRTSATGTSSKKVKKQIVDAVKQIADDIPECKDCVIKVVKAIEERLRIDSMSCYPVGVRVEEIVRPPQVERVIPPPQPIPIVGAIVGQPPVANRLIYLVRVAPGPGPTREHIVGLEMRSVKVSTPLSEFESPEVRGVSHKTIAVEVSRFNEWKSQYFR